MKKTIRLTERDLIRIVKKVINEQSTGSWSDENSAAAWNAVKDLDPETKFKQFLKEAEDYMEFIDPTYITVNVSVSGKESIVRKNIPQNNGYDHIILTQAGKFEPQDVLMLDINISRDAKENPKIAQLIQNKQIQLETAKIGVPGKHVITIPDTSKDIAVTYPVQTIPLIRIIIGVPSILEYKLGEYDDRGDFHMYFDLELSVLEKPMRITVNLGKSRFPRI